MLKLIAFVLLGAIATAQDVPKPDTPKDAPKQEEKKTEVRVNVLNVCTPSDAEQTEIKAALAKVPRKANFSADFEVSRGRTTMENANAARYLRLRRELDAKTGFSTAQYSISTDAEKTTETLVMKLANPKELFSISMEDRVTANAPATSLLDVDTPVNRINLERFGKSSLVLARCEGADQTVYEPIFHDASQIFAAYRKSLGLRGAFRSDLMWLMARSKRDEPKLPGVVDPGPKTKQHAEEKRR